MKNKGLELIGNYNSESRESIDSIKKAAIDLINVIDEHTADGRRKSIAFTHIEEAAMMAVKNIFHPTE